MKKLSLLMLIALGLLPFLFSQEPGSLMISECYLGGAGQNMGLPRGTGSYIELYNPGDSAVDLSKYRISTNWQRGDNFYNWSTSIENNYWPKGMLEAKGTHIVTVGNNLAFGLPAAVFQHYGNYGLWDVADFITNYDLSGDSTDRLIHSLNAGVLILGGSSDGSDSLVDVVSQQQDMVIAGDPGAAAKLIVRKYSVSRGNPDWDDSRGTNREDSEWIVTNFFYKDLPEKEKLPTTVKKHMNQTESGIAGLDAGISVDKANGVVTVPYGIRRDTLFRSFSYNDNVYWKLDWAPSLDDSSSFVMRSGDSITLFVCGNVLTEEVYRISVSEPTPDFNKVYPMYSRRYRSDEWLADNPGRWPWYWTTRYEATEGVSPIDSVYNIPWGTPVDTLMAHLDRAPQSTLSISWVDGTERTELKEGDTLVVTSEDGTVKKYYLNLLDYSPSSNAGLAAIIVDGDSLENFAPGQTYYNIKLPVGSEAIPQVIAVPDNQNAMVVAEAPPGLYGPPEDRSTVIRVTAQDDTTVVEYRIEWEVSRDLPIYSAEPFVSHIYAHWWRATNVGCMAIYNPNEYPLDMSEYMMVSSKSLSLMDQIYSADSTRILRPGYKLVMGDDGKHYFETQFEVPVRDIVPAKETFTIVKTKSPFGDYPNAWVTDNGVLNDGFWIVPSPGLKSGDGGEAFGLLKILNDSILDGQKALEDFVPSDIRMLDQVNEFGNTEYWVLADTLPMWNAKFSEARQHQLIRKSHIQKGNPDGRASFGDSTNNGESCEWEAYNFRESTEIENMLLAAFGNFQMQPITDHLPTVQSTVYVVTGGSSLEEDIFGVVTATTASQFMANIIPDDPDQALEIKDGVSGAVKTGTDAMTDGDTLVVVSANGEYTTKYLIDVTTEGLSGDATLSSSTYTVATEASTGTISGIVPGTTLEDVRDAVTVAQYAVLDILDSEGAVVPLEWYNLDTVMTSTTATGDMYFRVTAQDRATVITYHLVLDASSSDAYLLSDVYTVSEEPVRQIATVNQGTDLRTFLGNLIPAPGASVIVYNKLDQIREAGSVQFDDYVVVISADGTVEATYDIKFIQDTRSSDATLSSLTYDGTGVPEFDALTLAYDVILDQGTVNVPVVAGTASSSKAEVTAEQALNLDGTEAERTATLQVMAEDGSILEYTVTFSITTGSTETVMEQPLIYSKGKTIVLKLQSLTPGDRVSVFDISGKILLNRKLTGTYEEIRLNSAAGIYYVKLFNANEVYVDRVFLK